MFERAGFDDAFSRKLDDIDKKLNTKRCTDEDILMLACREIARSYTREEKDYM